MIVECLEGIMTASLDKKKGRTFSVFFIILYGKRNFRFFHDVEPLIVHCYGAFIGILFFFFQFTILCE